MSIPIDEAYLARFYAAAQAIADTINEVAAFEHETACKNAAANAIQTGAIPATVTAKLAVRPKADTFPLVEFESTGEPCSTKTPADFMPKPVVGEVGNGIGTLIPGTTNKYYDRTNQMHETGELRIVNSKRFVYWRPTPFQGFWVAQ